MSCPIPLPLIAAWPVSDSPASSTFPYRTQQAVCSSAAAASAHVPSPGRSGSCVQSPKCWIARSTRDGALRQGSLPVPEYIHGPRVPSKQHTMPAGAGFLKPSDASAFRPYTPFRECLPSEESSSSEVSYTFILPRAPFDRLLQIANEASKSGAIVSIYAGVSSVVVQPGYSGSLDECIIAVEEFLQKMDWIRPRRREESVEDADEARQRMGWYAYGGEGSGDCVESESRSAREEDEEGTWQAPHYTISP